MGGTEVWRNGSEYCTKCPVKFDDEIIFFLIN
jgi:hypothetical protein